MPSTSNSIFLLRASAIQCSTTLAKLCCLFACDLWREASFFFHAARSLPLSRGRHVARATNPFFYCFTKPSSFTRPSCGTNDELVFSRCTKPFLFHEAVMWHERRTVFYMVSRSLPLSRGRHVARTTNSSFSRCTKPFLFHEAAIWHEAVFMWHGGTMPWHEAAAWYSCMIYVLSIG